MILYSSKISVKCLQLLPIKVTIMNHKVISLLENTLTLEVHNINKIIRIF